MRTAQFRDDGRSNNFGGATTNLVMGWALPREEEKSTKKVVFQAIEMALRSF